MKAESNARFSVQANHMDSEFIQDKEEIWNIETRPGIQLKTGPIFL